MEHPTEELLQALVEKIGLFRIYRQPHLMRLVQSALDQSGWAILYIANPSEALQLEAVKSNYDALQYIKAPSGSHYNCKRLKRITWHYVILMSRSVAVIRSSS